MKKLKKSVKAIIISVVAIFCVVAIVLGVVLGTKKPDDNGGQSSTYGFSSAQQKLANEINKSALNGKTSYEIFDNSILTSFKPNISSENIIEFKSNYFVYADENKNNHLVIYRKKSGGGYEYKELTAGLTNNFSVKTNDLNYAVISKSLSLDLYEFSVVYFGNFDNVVEILNVESTFNNFISADYVYLTNTYFAYYDFGLLRTDVNIYQDVFDIYAFALKSTPLSSEEKASENCKISEVETSINLVAINGNNIVAENSEGVNVLSFEGGVTSKTVVRLSEVYGVDNANSLDVKTIYAGKNAIILEKRSFVEDDNVVWSDIRENGFYYNYEYKFLFINNDTIVTSELPLGDCSKIEVPYQSISNLSESYVIFRQMVNDNHELKGKYICTYFDKDLNTIIEYSSDSQEKIIFAANGSFLTTKRLISTRRNLTVVTRVEFVNDIVEGKYELYSTDVKNSVFAIRTNGGLYGIMDFNGNVLVNPLEYNFKPITISDNYIFGVHITESKAEDGSSVVLEEYCIYNINLNKFKKLDIEDSRNYYKLLENGFEGYFIYDANNEIYNLYGLNGGLIAGNINNVEFYGTDSGAILEIKSGNRTSSIAIESDKYFSYPNSNRNAVVIDEEEDGSEIKIEGYSFTMVDNTTQPYITIRLDGNNGAFNGTYEEGKSPYRGQYFKSLKLNLLVRGSADLEVELIDGNENNYTINVFRIEAGKRGSLVNAYSGTYEDGYGFVEFRVPVERNKLSIIDGYEIIGTPESDYYKSQVQLQSLQTPEGGTQQWTTVDTFYKWWYRGYARSLLVFNEDSEKGTVTVIKQISKPETSASGSKYLGYFTGPNPYDLQCVTELGIISKEPDTKDDEIWYAQFATSTYTLKYELGLGDSAIEEEFVSNLPTIADYYSCFYIPIPKREGYIFSGWSIGGMCSHSHFFSSDPKYLVGTIGSDNNTLTYDDGSNFVDIEGICYKSNSGTVKTQPYVTYFRNLRHATNTTVTFKANWVEIPEGYGIQFIFADTGSSSSNEGNVNRISLFDTDDIKNENLTYKNNVFFGGYVIENDASHTILTQSFGNGNKIYWTAQKAFEYPNNVASIKMLEIFNNQITEGSDAKKILTFTSGSGEDRINENVFLSPAEYLLAGWYYKDKDGGIHRFDDPNDNTKFSDTEGPLGSIDNISVEGAVFKLYAIFIERNHWIDYAWDETGGSAIEGENDINTDYKENLYDVVIENNLNAEATKQFNNSSSLAIKNDTKEGMIQLKKHADNKYNVTMTVQVPAPFYVMDHITLEHFPYMVSNNNYQTKDITFYFDWNPDGSIAILVDGVNNAGDYYYADYIDTGVNKIYISGEIKQISTGVGTSKEVCEVVISVENIDYTSIRVTDRNGKRPIATSKINYNAVNYFGTYGFTIKYKARSNYEKADNVYAENEFNFGSVSETNGYSEYYVTPIVNGFIWINGNSYAIGSNSSNFYPISGVGQVYCSFVDNNNNGFAYYKRETAGVNYVNTQIIAISPEQKLVWTSSNNSGFNSNNENKFYELNNYLSKITFSDKNGSQTFTLNQPTREIANNSYGSLSFDCSSLTELNVFNDYVSGVQDINYFGRYYTKLCGYEIEYGNSKYVLYLAYNSRNLNNSSPDNHVMYFLVSDGNLCGNDISLEFSEFRNELSIEQGLEKNGDIYNNNLTSGIETSFKKNGGQTWQQAISTTGTNSTLNIYPSDSYIFRFTPQAGYLIDSVIVRLGDTELINLSLNRASLGLTSLTGGAVSLQYGSSSEGIRNHIAYTGTANSFKSYYTGISSLSTNWGIYFGNYAGGSWNGTLPEFETLYLLISGAYEDVSIKISTISYFEFEIDDSANRLGLGSILGNNGYVKLDNLDNSKLAILKKNSSGVWNSIDAKNNYDLYLKKSSGLAEFYRIIFFGAASEFKNGFAMYSSGETYSYYFDSARFYGQSSATTLIGRNNISNHSLSMSGQLANIIYLEADNVSRLFENNGFVSNDHIRINKFTLHISTKINTYGITSDSYLFNANIIESGSSTGSYNAASLKNSIISTTEKISTSFYGSSKNIAVKDGLRYQRDNPNTKTDSWFNDITLSNIDYFYNNTSTNWQSSPSGIALYDARGNGLINGYGLHIKYYEIPGYYLEYIDFNFSTTDDDGGKTNNWVFLDAVTYATSSGVFIINGTYITYNIVYNAGDACFDIYLYNNESTNYESIVASLGILAGDVAINFYSKARAIDVNFNSNIGSSVSSSDTLSLNKNSISVYYDSLANLDAYMSMDGYTFVGWGSKEYYDNNGDKFDRFAPGDGEKVANIWNSASSWADISEYFDYRNLSKLKAVSPDTFGSSDFYIAGGYFVTDTGFTSTSRGAQVQSYNFWSAYSDLFKNSYGTNANDSFKYSIDLYGIWKANTYNVILNLNDADIKLEGETLKTNGSTISFFKHHLGLFDTTNSYDGVVGIGSLRYKGGSYVDASYYVFVTYDTNDWYILVNPNNKYSAKDSSVEVQSLKDYIIDRYGYTWLGWFAKQLTNYKETLNNKDLATLSVAATDRFAANAWGDDLPNFSYQNYDKFNSIVDNIDNIYEIDNSNSIYNGKMVSSFIYKNEFGLFRNTSNPGEISNTYIYFYTYNDNRTVKSGIYVYNSEDYLNVYNDRFGYNDYFTYFDTSKDYASYNSGRGNTSLFDSVSTMKNYNNLNTRDITIYAYWQTNYYEVIIDYTDKSSLINSPNSLTGVGSSAVSLQGKYAFENIYFDDESLTNRLNKFIPVRLGYDFIGWSFNPMFAAEGETLKNYEFNKAGKYILDGDLTNLLFAELAAREDLNDGSRESLGDEDDVHYIYLFAGWQAQTYTINVSLNITREGLENLYRADSEFALALYGASTGNYVGIKQSFAMQDTNTFVDIVANISFVITFDQEISSANFVINSSMTGGVSSSYSLDRLFATSAGYYLINWIYDPGNINSKVIENTLNSVFDENGNVKNVPDSDSYFVEEMQNQLFDEDFFNKLYHSSYVDGNAKSEKLSEIDFVSIMNPNIVRVDAGKEYFDTFIYSSNVSTNFGYFTIDGKDYYLSIERIGVSYYMYYYDPQGIKQYVQPYIEQNNSFVIANSLNSRFTFDDSAFYYSNFIIYFDDSEAEFNAYYVSSDYNNRTKLDIKFVLKTSISDFAIDGKDSIEYTALKTREFTIYAHWFMRSDLSVVVNNGNNSGETSENNNGLAGYYVIENSSDDSSESGTSEQDKVNYIEVKSKNENDESEAFVKLDKFNFYDNMKLDILPYFNGRFLSEMTFKFYSIEQVRTEANEINSSYQRVIYTLVLKFAWDNEKRIPKIVDTSSAYRTVGSETTTIDCTIVQNNGVIEVSGFDKLSNVDINGFNSSSKNTGLMKVDEYSNYDDIERLDINRMNILMQNVKSDIEVTCKFSIQTFDIDFYNVYDNNGLSLASSGLVESEEYTVGSFTSLRALLSSVDSARYSDGVSRYGVILAERDIINLSETTRLATISSDCAGSTETYNVPYGFFIYGNNQFDSPVSAEIGMGRERFGGYDFIYQYGYYNFGSTDVPINNELYQSSPLLGSPGLFGESIRKTSNLYTFVSWFEADERNGTFVLNEYSEKDEKTYISRNISLIGYYYANNKPTNIQFYTWDDSTNSYTQYTENIDEFTLQSTNSNSAYTESASTLIGAGEDGALLVDEKGRAIIKFNKSYGVDGVGFSIDDYNSSFIPNDAAGNNFNFVNSTLIRNYWYYRYQNYFLYFTLNNVSHYIRYDETTQGFYYLENENDPSSSKHYINMYSTDIKDPTFVVYADLDPENSGVVINNEIDLARYIQDGTQLTRLSVDTTEYIYNIAGAKMYAKYNNNYYEIKKLNNYLTDTELTEAEKNNISKLVPNALGTNVAAKYYVKLAGNIYYMIASNGARGSLERADLLYEYNESKFGGEGEFVVSSINESIEIVNLDLYYLMVDEDFYMVEFGYDVDEYGIRYFNPHTLVNTCNVPVTESGVEINIKLYFDYESKQFYFKYENGEYVEPLTDEIPLSKVYTPVNNNYSVSIIYNEETDKWDYDCVKIKSLPSPNIGFWYNNNSYSYIGYIKMLDSDIDYLVDKTLDDGNDANKQPYRDRIYDTLYKYIDTVYSDLSETERNGLKNQAIEYVNTYKVSKKYLSSLITVNKDGFIYKEGTNIIEAIDALITVVVPVTINGVNDTINTTVKFRFNLIDSETVINDSIHAIPIYNANIIEYTSNSASIDGTSVSVDISKMYVQYFETIENLYTRMYGVKYGDYLNFAILNETQFNSMIKSKNYPSELSSLLTRYDGSSTELKKIKVLTEEDYYDDNSEIWSKMDIDFSSYLNGKYYIVAYYNKSGQTYPVRVADNTICVSVTDGVITTSIVSTKSINNTLSL